MNGYLHSRSMVYSPCWHWCWQCPFKLHSRLSRLRLHAIDASGFISLAQNLGIALGLAISGCVFQNKAVDGLRSVLPSAPIAALRDAVPGENSSHFQTLCGRVN